MNRGGGGEDAGDTGGGLTWDDLDWRNAEGLAAGRAQSVEAVLVESREACAALAALVEGLPEAPLCRRRSV